MKSATTMDTNLSHSVHDETITAVEVASQQNGVVSDRRPEAMGRDVQELPSGYFYSAHFIGSYCAIGLAFACGTGGFALVAPILSQINNSFAEPSPNIVWVGIVYALMQAIMFLLVGRLSDIFGRRWFFIIGSAIGTAGSIVASTAQGVGQIIAGEVLIGIAAGFQISFFWVVAEIVPMNRRFLATSGLFLCSVPTNALGPKVALTMQANTASGWRSCFYLLIALNAASTLCWYLFYYPPNFNQLHQTKTAMYLLRNFDYVGLVLFSAAMVLLLAGLNWGGVLYPWASAYVLGTVISGAVCLVAFALYETFMPLEEPYLPVALLRNTQFTSCAVWCAIAAMTFYAFGLIWPRAVTVLYPELSPEVQSTYAGLVTMCFVFGQMVGPFCTNWIRAKPFVIVGSVISLPLLTALATDPLNITMTLAFLITGNFILGAADGVALPMTTFPIRTQEEIGTAGGLSGSIRLTGTTIAVAMYSTILNNRLEVTVPRSVGTAVARSGLPQSVVPTLIAALNKSGRLLNTTVQGLTVDNTLAIEQAYRLGNSQAYKTVFLSTLGFGALSVVLVWFIGGVDESDPNYVASQIAVETPPSGESVEGEKAV